MGTVLLLWTSFYIAINPSKISQSLGFYQVLAKGSSCRLIRSLPSSNRRWKRVLLHLKVLGKEPC